MVTDTDPDAFLNDLDALNLTSPVGVDGTMESAQLQVRGRRGPGERSAFGVRAGSGGSPTPTQFPVFDFTTASRHGPPPGAAARPNLYNSHHHQQPGASANMDLANFNVFGDKPGDTGRRDDNVNPSQSGGPTQSNVNNINFDALQQLLSMQMQYPMSMPGSVDGNSSANHVGSPSNPNATMLLEQQLRLHQLQQLQQLQNQIFQQQIELISGQASLSNSLEATPLPTPAFRDTNQFQGLPTPANSTELRPQPPPNFVSPMILQNYLTQQGGQVPGVQQQQQQAAATAQAQFANSHHGQLPQGPSSAPAHLAFSTQAPLLSPGDLEFDLSPLTSPWLGAASYQQAQQQLQQQQSQAQSQSQSQSQAQALNAQTQGGRAQNDLGPKRRASKRGASSSGEDADGRQYAQARKRQSPAIRATIGTGGSSRKAASSSRGSVSMSSTPAMTPAFRAQQSRRDSVVGGEVVGDTPSPVDLSMPPPAPPTTSQADGSANGANGTNGTNGVNGGPISVSVSTSASSGSGSVSSALSPVTPASIMNLGRLGLSSGLSSPHGPAEDQHQQNSDTVKAKGKGKSKTPPKPSISTTSASSQPQPKTLSKKSSPTSLVSPSFKPLLPGGLSTPTAQQLLGSASNYTHHLSGSAAALQIAPSTPLPPPAPAVRKTSHKAAEQKRRDSLKSTFDQLRFLLPPLPLPNDEGYQGDGPLPPGAMPPRGPPRGDVSGPNRAVSKLMLLRCGNEYIRMLQARVERRDEYIRELKREVVALRARVSGDAKEVGGAGVGGAGGAIEEGEGMRGEDVDAMTGDIERVDLDKDIDAEEENAPKFGLGGPPISEAGDEADEECD